MLVGEDGDLCFGYWTPTNVCTAPFMPATTRFVEQLRYGPFTSYYSLATNTEWDELISFLTCVVLTYCERDNVKKCASEEEQVDVHLVSKNLP